MDEDAASKKKRERKLREPTPQWLRQRALSYLDRFPATTMKMRQHLFSKAKPGMEQHGLKEADVRASIDGEIEKLVKSGILNDAEFANSKARLLVRQGKSTSHIRNKLLQLEFTGEQVGDALAALDGSAEARDLQAAARYVRKRKFGPYKAENTRSERYQKEMASLARNGFSYDVAKKVLSMTTVGEVEEILL
jgi:regulatory protein